MAGANETTPKRDANLMPEELTIILRLADGRYGLVFVLVDM